MIFAKKLDKELKRYIIFSLSSFFIWQFSNSYSINLDIYIFCPLGISLGNVVNWLLYVKIPSSILNIELCLYSYSMLFSVYASSILPSTILLLNDSILSHIKNENKVSWGSFDSKLCFESSLIQKILLNCFIFLLLASLINASVKPFIVNVDLISPILTTVSTGKNLVFELSSMSGVLS